MIKFLRFALLLALLPTVAHAAGRDQPMQNTETAPARVQPRLEFAFNLRAGVGSAPAYFGADKYVPVPDFALGFEFLQLPGGRQFGSNDPNVERFGFRPRGSLRIIRSRTAADNPELTGLNDVDLSVEMGLGLGYQERNFRAFADARFGAIGHNAWVGELGADLVARSNDRLTMTFGPRVFLGDTDYARTYFGVTAAESVASGLAAYAPTGGVLSAGLELGATYEINEQWGLAGAIRWERLLNDAAASPITALGSTDNFKVRIGAVRRFSIRF